ncbi:MAG: SRPBCC domain-containing protein [Alphaproteobacteria bacterium]|nr:SRPBCC domain-containing protein [Alphaproteobacteria bacterium]
MDARPSATLRRRFDAPPARVYSAWTDPVKLGKWFGPARVVSAEAEADVRVGGRFRVRLTTNDGERHEVGGEYREIVPEEKLVFTWAWHSTPERESLVTVRLKPDGDGTVLILTHEQLFDEASRDRHVMGWTGSFDKLEAFLA